MCSKITKAELKSLDQLRASKLNTETRQAFEDLYALIVDEDDLEVERRTKMTEEGYAEMLVVMDKMREIGVHKFNVPITTSVAILKAFYSPHAETVVPILNSILHSAERTGDWARS